MARSTRRQRIRRGIILVSFILFPVTMYYLSPALIIMGAFEGVATGSFVVFTVLFASSLFVGRLFCGWVCPGAGMQEALFVARNRRVRPWANVVKYIVWLPWLSLIVFGAMQAGGIRAVRMGYQTTYGLSVASIDGIIVYVAVVLTFAVLALVIGRRAACHTICWMAPFMILGRKLRNVLAWPSLRLRADAAKCTQCGACTRECPMSLGVMHMVQRGSMEAAECILCGVCVDGCPEKAIHYSFSRGKT
jgi:polyferredoxin